MGEPSGAFSIDIDDPQALIDLESKYGPIPKTVTAISGRGCPHYYFRYDPNYGDIVSGKLKDGSKKIDVRWTGVYVIAPPSIHKSGTEYTWLHDPETTSLADAPAWLVELLPRRRETETASNTQTATVPPKPPRCGTEASTTTLTIHDPDAARVAAYLATVPPAISGQGGMNATFQLACKLIELFGHSRSNEQLLDDLASWNERCVPPWNDKELRRKLLDARTKTGIVCHGVAPSEAVVNNADESTNEQTPTTTTTTPTNAPLPWPTLNDHALHGIAGEIVKRIEPQSETDPVALLVTLLTSFGATVGRSPYFVVEATKHHANIFSCLVGRSSRARKGTSLERIKDVFRDLVPPTLSGLSSGEGLIDRVRDDYLKPKPTKDGIAFEKIPGVNDKRLWIIESEFARTLGVIKRDENTLSSILRDTWDHGNLSVVTRTNPLTATDAHIGMTTHITMDELGKTLDDKETFNGFANRFLFAVVKRSKLLPDGGDDIPLDDLRQRLANAIEQAKRIGRMTRSEDCKTLWRKAYPLLVEEKTGTYDAITSRADPITLRLSMLYALLDGSSVIEANHLRAALALWCYCDHSAEYLFSKTITGTETREKILELVNEETRGEPLSPQRGDGIGNAIVSETITTTETETTVTNTTTTYTESVSLTEQEFLSELTGKAIPVEPATLSELLDYRNAHGGRFERRADGVIMLCILDTPDIPPAITQAVQENQSILVSMVVQPELECLADEEFLNELRGKPASTSDAELDEFIQKLDRLTLEPEPEPELISEEEALRLRQFAADHRRRKGR